MKSGLTASVAFATALIVGTAVPLVGARANTLVYSQDFDSPLFKGTFLDQTGSGDPHPNQTDRYDPSFFYTINNALDWTFTGSAFWALGGGATGDTSKNGAVYLNEPNGVGTTVQSLDSSKTYSLSFIYWGDNRPGEAYTLYVTVNGVLVDTINDTDKVAGTNPGTLVTINGLTTDGAGNLSLLFSQGTSHEGSPIFDNVQISRIDSTPLPATLPLFVSGLGALGLLSWRRKRKAKAAI